MQVIKPKRTHKNEWYDCVSEWLVKGPNMEGLHCTVREGTFSSVSILGINVNIG